MKIKEQNKVLQELIDGNKRFLAGKSFQSPLSSLQKLKDFAKNGQNPKAIILCCSDSRGPVEMIFDQDIGDLFVIRVAGNIVAPSLVGSIEFAASTFGTSLVVVMGHSQCGAVTATLQQIETADSETSKNIHAIVKRIKPHIKPIAKLKDLSFEEKLTRSIEANVIASVGQIESSSELIENLISKNELIILGAVLELSSGKVTFIEE
jgi:carbonic anhydrase